MDAHVTVQIGGLQQRYAETAKAMQQLSRETNAAQQALMKALQAEGLASVCTTQFCFAHSLQAFEHTGRHR